MAILSTVLTKLKKLFILLFAIIKKTLCCCRRRRPSKNDDNLLPVTVQSTIGSDHKQQQQYFPNWPQHQQQQQQNHQQYQQQQQHNHYHQQQQQQQYAYSQSVGNYSTNNSDNNVAIDETQDGEEQEEDFFKDMVPKFKRTKKMYVGNNQSNNVSDNSQTQHNNNRFGVDMKATIFQTQELGTMDHYEDVGNSWEDSTASDDIWVSDESLRELRQQERERKIAEHRRIKLEKELKKAKPKSNLLATKIS
ncbi:GATA zinc finger domain-containing protein 10-like [Oppia nitens]|uniref:GATA zinc finger domain-containing protein 10-like n=1 Tax=Oppia nitens TaxID=1686743 RepID=UPI0023DC81D0|nr:GATA zinc finger domain-containing protein 10-like [Oppia nitens]